MRNSFLISAVALTSAAGASGAQVAAPDWFIWHDRVAPAVSATVSLDSATGDFVYRYTLANGNDAAQRVNSLLLELPAPASGAAAPAGWEAILTPRTVTWLAVGDVDPAWQPTHELDLPSFTSEVAPGAQREGFVLRSPCGSGLTPATYYVTGYDHLGVPPEEDTARVAEPGWRDDAVRGTTIAPVDCGTVADWGNRRPGVDGFMGLVNFADGVSLPAGPVTVQVRFGRDGETIDRASFRATLNSADVTATFVTNSRGDRVAVFTPGSSALRSGRNVLLLEVSGMKPGSTQRAKDADRFTFTLP